MVVYMIRDCKKSLVMKLNHLILYRESSSGPSGPPNFGPYAKETGSWGLQTPLKLNNLQNLAIIGYKIGQKMGLNSDKIFINNGLSTKKPP